MRQKKYVFMIPSLSNMGGAQMYVRNKYLYLIDNGWDVIIISGQCSNVVINELRKFDYCFSEIKYYKYFYSKRKQKKIVDKIVDIINPGFNEDIVVESSTLRVSTWGESVAKELKAKHLIYLLQETNSFNNSYLLEFLKFKHKRRELAGISKSSLQKLFEPFFQLSSEESYYLSARCSNVEADVDSPYIQQIDKSQYDFIVGGLSRLEKEFVMSAIDDFYQYASENKQFKFLLLWIGDAPKGSVIPDLIIRKMQALPNVKFIMTGYLYPVPTRLLELCDVFISSAGSAWVCERSGVPTIIYDAHNFRPMGILGRTVKHTLYREETDHIQEFNQLMDDILIEKSIGRTTSHYKQGLPDFKDHLSFLEQSCLEINYFDMDSIRVNTIKERFIKFVGPKRYIDFCLKLRDKHHQQHE